MSALAIDFETAYQNRSSACALGLAVIDGLSIHRRASLLIRPPELDFHPMNVAIHGITHKDVADQPTFKELWPRFSRYFQNRLILAHNASFDLNVLCQILDAYQLSYPVNTRILCTLQLAKRVWPKLRSHRLDVLALELGIGFKHHEPVQDAAACATISVSACKKYGVHSVEELARRLGIRDKPLAAFRRGAAHLEKKAPRPSNRLSSTLTPQRALARLAWDAMPHETVDRAIDRAARELLSIEMVYQTGNGEVSQRVVDIGCRDDAYFYGYCQLRNEHRTFRISRVCRMSFRGTHPRGRMVPSHWRE